MSAARKLRRAQARPALVPARTTDAQVASLADASAHMTALVRAIGTLASTLSERHRADCTARADWLADGSVERARANSAATNGMMDLIALVAPEAIAEFPPGQVARAVRSVIVAENTIRNLPRLAATPIVTASRLLDGMTAIVVGAGASLRTSLPLLARVADRSFIITTNSAARSVCEDLRPGVIVCAEHLDASESLEGTSADAYAILPAAAASHWRVARPLTVPWARSTSVGAAVRLAIRWGASRIVLVGVDLAGEAYSHDSPPSDPAYATRSWQRSIEAATIPGDPIDPFRVLARILPRALAGADPDLSQVPAWGGGTTYSAARWRAQRDELAALAPHTHADLIHAAGPGAAQIPGWREVPLEALDFGPKATERPTVAADPPPPIAPAVADLRAEVRETREAVAAGRDLRHRGLSALARDPARAAALVSSLAAPTPTVTDLAARWLLAGKWSVEQSRLAAADRAEALLSEAGY